MPDLRRSKLIIGAFGVALVPVAWWLVGDLSSAGFEPAELDYFIKAPEALERNASTAGVIGAGVALALLVASVWLHRRGDHEQQPWKMLAAAAGLGLFVGWSARVFTAGGIGANIGAGLLMWVFVGGIFALVFTARRSRQVTNGP